MSTLHEIRERLFRLEDEIDKALQKARRPRQEISLVAVSKGHDFSKIMAAFSLGLKDFGENYAQEFLAKFKQNHEPIRWHFIGGIQSNKIDIIKHADVVHSISSWRHAELLDGASLKPIEVFLQVNLGDKDRQGFSPSEVLEKLAKPWPFLNLKFMGLMTILPLKPVESKSYWFSQMARLKEKVQLLGISQVKLSMGMSDDFAEAIMHGANYIRIGTKIFGER